MAIRVFCTSFFSGLIWAMCLIAAQPVRDPQTALAAAERYAEAGNWDAARPLYAEAEAGFQAKGDERNRLYAKFGRLHRDLETGSYSEYLAAIDAELASPVAQSDPAVRIRGLALKATVIMNLNSSAARRDWQEIARLADAIGDKKWANRSAGELALLAGLDGDYATALPRLLGAIKTAEALGDVGSEVYFKTFLANGMTVVGRPEQALPFFGSAIAAVTKNPESGYPLVPTIGKVRALTMLKRDAEARALIAEALQYADEHQVLGARTELLVQSGLLSLHARDLDAAEAAFQQAAKTAREATLPRMIAPACSGLIDVYETRGNWMSADTEADEAIAALREAEEGYDLPELLAKKAEIAVALGQADRADEIYGQATQLVESMLVNMPSSQTKRSLIGSMSRLYTGHFRLAVEQFNDTSRAFDILEHARGRSLADSLRYGGRADQSPTAWERQITTLQQKIRRTR
ncbi:MAG: hypothetical protein JOZ62_12585, partial [Acidobacteriaceae bacterium]|nr:hypothetical protein [Acidobacteriaceae bacterium]